MPDGSELLSIGRITGTHGIRGMLKVHLFAGDDSTVHTVDSLTVSCPDGRTHSVQIASLQGHGRKSLVSLKGYAGINEVLPFVGGELLIRRDQLPETEADEYYWADLIGLKVLTADAADLGILSEIIETGSNDVYVVRGRDKEYLVPALEDVVLDVDLEAGTMTISPPDGLLDL